MSGWAAKHGWLRLNPATATSDDHRVPGAIQLGGSLEVMSKLEAVGYRLEVAGGFG